MNRRSFLKKTSLGIAATLSGSRLRAGSPAQNTDKPNILFIMSDEHNANVLGCYGNDIVMTPNLDQLSQQGVTFENCYCNSPLCVPSRLSFIAGKYASHISSWNNKCWLPADDFTSLAWLMNEAGYESILCGKMHFDKTRRYGFTEIGGNMNKSNKTGLGGRRNPDNLTPKNGMSGRFDDFITADDSSVMQHDRSVTEAIVDFLRTRKAGDKPFFLLAGYLAPHFPLIVPEKYWQHYKGQVPLPEIPEGHLESQPLNYQHLRIAFNMEEVPDDIVRKGRELYYGLTQWLDEAIGKVLTALQDNGLAGNTIVIYTTDHGENMGEHGLWWKNCMYDHASRVPLIFSWPNKWSGNQRRKPACSLIDVAATIADIAGAQIPEDWDGDSMLHWLEDEQSQWKDVAVSEYYGHNIASGMAMIRKGSYKYVYHTRVDENHGPEMELYALQKDPDEFNNLALGDDYSDIIGALHASLVEELGEEPDLTEKRARTELTAGYNRDTKVKAPIRNDNRQFILAQNYPNPFNPATTIRFELANPAKVILVVYDNLGEETATLAEEFMTAGLHEVKFNATDLPTGTYFYKLQAGHEIRFGKMIHLK